MKKKVIAIALAVVLLASLGGAAAVFSASDQIPSAKCAFVTNEVQGITLAKHTETTGWVPVLTTQVKTGDPKDLIIDVSAECALVTNVKLSGTDGSEAKANIKVRVLVDGNPADPGVVVFSNRILKIEGDLSHHGDQGDLGLDDHEIEIFLKTKSANAFNFCIENVGSGVHDIVIQAKVTTAEEGLKGTAKAYVGNISAVVDEVMLKRVGEVQ